MSPREHVLGVATEHFRKLGVFQGFSPEVDFYLPSLLYGRLCEYRPRDQAETDPEFKQLIPYCVFRYKNTLFHYRRGKGVGESRLAGLLSIGLGGHINPSDAGSLQETSYRAGLARELAEEIASMAPSHSRPLGLVNDDSNDVGRVHLGIVHLFELEAPLLQLREPELESLGFIDVNTLLSRREQLETWTGYILDSGVLS